MKPHPLERVLEWCWSRATEYQGPIRRGLSGAESRYFRHRSDRRPMGISPANASQTNKRGCPSTNRRFCMSSSEGSHGNVYECGTDDMQRLVRRLWTVRALSPTDTEARSDMMRAGRKRHLLVVMFGLFLGVSPDSTRLCARTVTCASNATCRKKP